MTTKDQFLQKKANILLHKTPKRDTLNPREVTYVFHVKIINPINC